MRFGMLVLCVLAGLSVGEVEAAVSGVLKFHNPGLAKQPQAVVKMVTTLQTRLADLVVLESFSHAAYDNDLHVKFWGKAKEGITAHTASERTRQAAVAAADTMEGTKLSEYQVRIELDEPAAGEQKVAKIEKDIEVQQREKARPSPRLEIQVKDKLFTELTILDVPLVRALDQIGRQMPLSYVLHVQVVGQPIYVRLQDATLEEALQAIADSGNLKIEKQGKYLKFLRADPPAK